ncbi:MAG TPA: hypothetical protein PK286_10375 [Devosia sp.]|nr:hypothetical protein [Devosia sp.]
MTFLRSGLTTALVALLALGSFGGTASAQQMQNLGTFKNWTAWKGTDANGEMCYISAAPTGSEPAGVKRSPIHFLIIHRKGLGTKNEVQTLIGYPFSSGEANASAAIDGKAYVMMTEGEAAWLASAEDEGSFVAAMKAGTKLTVKGTSQRGTNTTDTYDLGGVTAAMGEIDKACA